MKNKENKKIKRKRRSRSRCARQNTTVIRLTILCLFLLTGIIYTLHSKNFRETFLPNTSVNGINISGMTVRQAGAAVDQNVSRYALTLKTRGGGEELIRGQDIDLRPEYGQALENLLAKQSPLSWGYRYFKGIDYPLEFMVVYDSQKLADSVYALKCLDPENIEAPADACLRYTAEAGYQIIPEQQGNEPVPEKLLYEISEAVMKLSERVSLEELDVYRKPEILADDAILKAQAAALSPYAEVTVTYHFGSRTEVLDGNTIHQWLSCDSQGDIVIDQSEAAEYVKKLAETYNTAYRPKNLKTSYGPTVTITSGHYGWLINQKAETEALMEIIYSCQSQDREPIYSQKAASHDGADYGTTYAELNLTAQHFYFYKDGKLLVESDFVSGNEARGWSTPAGAFQLTYKQRNATLKGKGYATPVSYWMPFNGNIGMHDGYWRSSFGGTIYKKNGSHGCVNLPPSVAKTVYENIEAGMPVLCYHLDGTEQKSSSAAPGSSQNKSGSKKADVLPDNPLVPETGTQVESSVPETKAQEGPTAPETTIQAEPSVPETTVQAEPTMPETTVQAESPVPETNSQEEPLQEVTPIPPVPESLPAIDPATVNF